MNDLGSSWFGGPTNSKLTVCIAKKGTLLHDFLPKRSAAALYSNLNIAIIDEDLYDDESLHGFVHEYAHFHMLSKMSELDMGLGDIPDWFHEGLAEAFAHRFAPLPFDTLERVWNVVPFSEMKLRGIRLNPDASDWYIMGQFTVERMLHEFDEAIIMQLITSKKTTDSFEKAVLKTTKKSLDEYHNHLLKDDNLLENIHEHIDNNNWSQLEKQLLTYDKENGPYYYNGVWVYDFLVEIYHNRQDWEKALEMLLKKTEYVQSSEIWRAASEYAMKLNDEENALHFEKKAEEYKKRGGIFENIIELNEVTQ